jgi:hypothetical protein
MRSSFFNAAAREWPRRLNADASIGDKAITLIIAMLTSVREVSLTIVSPFVLTIFGVVVYLVYDRDLSEKKVLLATGHSEKYPSIRVINITYCSSLNRYSLAVT